MSHSFWLMKAEPETRLEKGKDVCFSVDDFEAAGTTMWEGVRNHEAKNLMKEMKVGDKVLFYHSNCKVPGVAGFATVCKEAYPDHTAWDKEHPYYDPKTDPENPKWFMVDLKFTSKAAHLVPLALLKLIAATSSAGSRATGIEYIEERGFKAIQGTSILFLPYLVPKSCMSLVGRGRLSVQHVEEPAWDAMVLLSEKGGWDNGDLGLKKPTKASKPTLSKAPPKGTAASKKRRVDDLESETGEGGTSPETTSEAPANEARRSKRLKT